MLNLNQKALVMEPPLPGMASTKTGSAGGVESSTAKGEAAVGEQAVAGQGHDKAIGGCKPRAAIPTPLSMLHVKKPRGTPAANAAGSKRIRRRNKPAASSSEAALNQ